MGNAGKKRIWSVVILVVGVLLGLFVAPHILPAAAYQYLPSFLLRPFRLGLDLQGGTHLVYRADVSGVASGERGEAMEGLRDVIERRVNFFGVTEPVVQVDRVGDDYRLIVELAGVKDINEAIRLIGQTPFLEFREEGATITPTDAGTTINTNNLQIDFVPTKLNGKYLERAELNFDPTTGEPLISVSFNAEGTEIFAELTEKNLGKRLGIYLDGLPISGPVVQEKIEGGKAQITGRFTLEEARNLVRNLNSGALPVPIILISQQSVEAALGSDSLAKSLSAAVWGFAAVALFMIFWYRLSGFISVVALLVYAVIVLALFKAIPVTLSAAGIAGFILSMGMAVDANVLIFERTKEELKRGRHLAEAIHEGFVRAWTSIRDSNVSSIISAVVLYSFGTNVIKGFALTLGIGVVISMFSAITVSRTFLMAVMTPRLERFRGLFSSGFHWFS
ncbi:MAG: protein translocase subunit SecD [bacterium]|nr:protein translocase subunit SecD [bacterium]